MNAFYNKQGVGDVLLVQLTLEKPEKIHTEQFGDVTLIKNGSRKSPVSTCSKQAFIQTCR